LKNLFATNKTGLVIVICFLSWKGLLKHFENIAWGTDVWVADVPDHMIHLNGERLFGPN
jgi:hypothetical protein